MSKAKTTLFKRTLPQAIGILLVALGLIGFFASADLSIEKVALLQDPNYEPTCNISPILSCGSVMVTPQAAAFGFPNPFIGVAGFAIVSTVGMAILAGATFRRWFWLGLQAGATFGVLFVTWLQYQSIFAIGALCPWCMVVWTVTIPIFWYVLLYNLRGGHIRLPGMWQRFADFGQRHHLDVLIGWYALIIIVILYKFWYYWSTLL